MEQLIPTSIGLIGKNYTRFGETLNENMLHLLENFANTNAPNNSLKVCFGTTQQIVNLKFMITVYGV